MTPIPITADEINLASNALRYMASQLRRAPFRWPAPLPFRTTC